MPPGNEMHIFEIRQSMREALELRGTDAAVDMDGNRAARIVPVPGNGGGSVQRLVNEHEKADPRGHAQFPVDMRPSISSCRQLRYRSDQSFQSPGAGLAS